ncbi:MAG: aspartate 1-decarboxylase [Candidatus Dadabacteria bacterium]|nr:MAG: aspartate 1-decarboxylase [Candidatus Dadabacteria bacterium]
MEELIRVLHAKIHGATVTHADLNYEGSITIPPDLMKAANLLENEVVAVWDITNGNRIETYAISGEEGSRYICANGAAAHLIREGDEVIIASFRYISAQRARNHIPRLIFLDEKNEVKRIGKETPGPAKCA